MIPTFKMKTHPVPGICPVARCRRRRGTKKTLCHTHHSQVWRAKSPARAAWINLQSHARERGIEFDLTFAQFLHFVTLTGYIEEKGVTSGCLHVDRIDAAKGYTADNIQVLTCSENVAKENRQRYVPYFQNRCRQTRPPVPQYQPDEDNPF